ncbi:MAG: glycosyltransferase [Candidatus Helarchaeota archaeon]
MITLFYGIVIGIVPLFIKRKSEKYTGNALVSIIIPVFNDGIILEKNLQNLLKLTYPNYEILVVYSKKSTDNTEEIALSYAEKYDNIKAFPEEVSRAYALNLGIDKAKGEFILFLDSDIFVFNDFIECALGYFRDDNVKLVSSCFLGLNATQNIVTRVSWALSNVIAFYGVNSSKLLSNIAFMGFGGVWRKDALIEAGKFSEDSVIEDAELNLRVNKKFRGWRGIFDDQLFCYQFFPTDFKTLYLQQMRWNLANIKYTVKGFFSIGGMGVRQKIIYISSFLMVILIPMITYFSLGMIFVQFFANFFQPDISFGGGVFYFILGVIAFFLSFGTMIFFIYPKYRGRSHVRLSRRFIVIGIFVIIYLVGVIFAVVSLNSLKNIITGNMTEKMYVKVDKSEYQFPSNQD